MFESDDWIFEDAFEDVEGNWEETRKKSHSPCQNEEKTPSVKRRKVDSREALLSLSTNTTFVQKSKVDNIANIKDNEPPSKDRNVISRENLLLGIFQKIASVRKTSDFEKEKEPSEIQGEMQCFQPEVSSTPKVFQHEKSRGKSREPITKVQLGKEVKLIRIFPGPAGLVPENVRNDTILPASYLSSVEELENKASTKRIEIKSQDEKNLCGEKAWKLLLNDLPNNFLQDYKISTVQDRANAGHCDSTKISFIAGVLDYVDHSHEDPFVVLKDSTGNIEGTIHREIPSTYPGALEPNVVVLLCDVGLIKTTTYVVTNKYHILVSLVNLVAIYSDKGRIVSTPHMESILSRTSNIELNRFNSDIPISKKPAYVSELQKMGKSYNSSLQTSSRSIDSSIKKHEFLAKNSLLHPMNEKYESCGEALKNDENSKVTDELLGRFDCSMDTDDFDAYFTTDCDFTTFEEQNCLNHSPSKSISQTSKIQQCNLQARNTKWLENTKKEPTINFKDKEQTKVQCLPQKCIADIETCDINYSRENCFSSFEDTTRTDSNLNVKSTLQAIKRNAENSKSLLNYFTDNKCDGYDSDDEMLSQLDI